MTRQSIDNPRRPAVSTLAAILVAVPLAASIAHSPAGATVLTTGCASDVECTLTELNDGGTITVDDKLFSNWSVDFISTTSASDVVDPDAIFVSGLDGGGLQPGPGLFFDSFAAIEANGDGVLQGFVELDFSFDVTVLDTTLSIKDNSLELFETFFNGGGGIVAVFETLLDDNGNFIDEKVVFEDNQFGDFQFFDSAVFSPTQFLNIEVSISALTDFTDTTAAIDAFSMRFSQVPEPLTLGLFGIGLAGLGHAVWRHKLR